MLKSFIRNPPVWVSFVLFVILCGVVFFLKESMLAYQSLNQNVEKLLGERAQSIAEMAAAVVNPETHQAVVRAYLEENPEIKKSEEFIKLQRILRRIQLIHKLEHDISTLVWMRTSPPNTLARILSGNRGMRVGKHYIVRAEAFQVFEDRKAHHTAFYQTDDGTWVSGFAPVKDKSGNVIAVVAVQLRADMHISDTGKNILARAGTSSAAVIFFLVGLAVWFANRMRHAWVKNPSGSGSESLSLGSAREIEAAELEKARLRSELEKTRQELTEQHSYLEFKEEEMETMQKLHQNIVDCFSEGCLVFRKDGALISVVSQNSEALFGEKCHSKHLWNFLEENPGVTRQRLSKMFGSAHAFEKAASELPKSFDNHEGTTIELSYYPFRNKSDQLSGIVVIGSKKALPADQLGSRPPSLSLSRQRLLRFLQHLSRLGLSTEIQENFVAEFLREPVSLIARSLADHARQVAQQNAKAIAPLHIKGGELLVVPETFASALPGLKNAIGFSILFGIESRAKRLEREKPALGNVSLSFEIIRESMRPAWLFITLEDDGGGISISSLRKNLRARGEQTDSLSDFQVLQRVLDARYAMGKANEAELYTLQKAATELGGQVELQTSAGRGTQITVMLPYQEARIGSQGKSEPTSKWAA